MKINNVRHRIVIVALCLTTFHLNAQQWDFHYGFLDAFSTNALQYVVQQQNVTRSTESGGPTDGLSYWNPATNDAPAILTFEFSFPAPTAQIFLNAVMTSYNFGGGEYGSCSLSASKDGTNWVLLENGPTPSGIALGYPYATNLPVSLTGSTNIWIQETMQTSGSVIMAQFLRQDTSGTTNDVFDLNVKYGSTIVQTIPLLTNGLVAYYPFNGNANDASGNGNNGTVLGATLTADRFGVPGMAYNFNGSNSYIFANVPNLPTGASPRSVSLWAKAQPIGAQGAALVWWGDTQGYDYGGACAILNIGNPYTWSVGGEGGGNGVDSGVAVDTNWHNIALVYDGATMSIWLDGINRGANAVPINTPLSPLFIGAADQGAYVEYYSGAIDDVLVYNRALSPLEIAEIYQSSLLAGIVTVPGIIVAGNSNQVFSIQYVTDISSTNWTTLVSDIVLQGNSYIYPDTSAVGQPQRFYRIVGQ